MGQVIRLPVPAAEYPDRSAALDPAECVLLIAMRWWVAEHRHGVDPLPRLCEAMRTAGAHDAAFSVDRLMSVVAVSTVRPIEVCCPRCPRVSNDEKCLLHAASLAQFGDGALAEKALRAAPLSAQGAEFALCPLRGLAELFAEARLLFRRRAAPQSDPVVPGVIETWVPAAPLGTVH